MNTTKQLNRQNPQTILKNMIVCRFCLSMQANKLDSIYVRNPCTESTAPLTVQIMTCASLEVFSDDGMPSLICFECRLRFEHSYRFKQMCKRAENLLRQFPLTGEWPSPLSKPKIPPELVNQIVDVIKKRKIPKNGRNVLLNANPAKSPLHQSSENGGFISETQKVSSRPKIFNNSTKLISNKEADITVKPLLSKPTVTRNEDGHMEIVTEILDPNIPYKPEGDAIKNAVPVATNVFPCPHCDRSFPLLQLRDIHMVNHTRQRNFQCNLCNKSFFSKYDLQKHAVTHLNERPFKCTICEKGFTRATLLKRHEKIHTDIPKFICIYCEKAFISQLEMEKHTVFHEKNRPHKCKICSKTFVFKQGLERHKTIHLRDQPYPCQYCKLSFGTPSKLQRHLTAHVGKRPYPCKLCPKSYLLSHHLTRHMRSHRQGSVSFQCAHCELTFEARNELIKHSKIHSGNTLCCALCKENFNNTDDINAHIKEHAEGEAYACEFCDLIFVQGNILQNHIDDCHVDEMAAYYEDDKAQLGSEMVGNDNNDNSESSNVEDGESSGESSEETSEESSEESSEEDIPSEEELKRRPAAVTKISPNSTKKQIEPQKRTRGRPPSQLKENSKK